jgi:hypothetical protein
MGQYNHSVMTGFPKGPLHLSLDGAQAKTTGELNQYMALAPNRPSGGVAEICAWLPLQVVGNACGARRGCVRWRLATG